VSTTANVKNYVRFSGDQDSELLYSSGDLYNSPAMSELVSLAIGDNEIEVPNVDDFVVHGVVIQPPSSNSEGITLMGAGGDTGIPISASLPTILQFGDTAPASIYLSVAAEVTGLRVIWF
jgi:hypothetical protein